VGLTLSLTEEPGKDDPVAQKKEDSTPRNRTPSIDQKRETSQNNAWDAQKSAYASVQKRISALSIFKFLEKLFLTLIKIRFYLEDLVFYDNLLC